MRRGNYYIKFNYIFAISIVLLLIVMAYYAECNIINENLSIKSVGEKWILVNEDNINEEVNLPCTLSNKDDKIVIEKTLKIDEYTDPTLLLRSELQEISVYINNGLYKKFEKSDEQRWGKEPESKWIFVDLPADEKEINIKIIYSSQYKRYNGVLNNIYLGDKSDEIIYILKTGRAEFIISLILMAVGVILLSMYFGLGKGNNSYNNIFYLALLDILCGLWIGTGSKLLDLFLKESFPRAEIKMLSMYLIPIVFLQFYKEMYNKKDSNILKYTLITISVFVLCVSILHFTNIKHFVESIALFHILCVIEFIICILMCIKEFKYINRHKSIFIIGVSFIILSSLIDIVSFYNIRYANKAYILDYAAIIFTMLFSYSVGKEFIKEYSNNVKAEIYKEMAYKDVLTGLYNRAAFDEKMYEMNLNLKKYNGTPIFIFDLNNLRKMNNTLGHDKGNKYIVTNAKVLYSIFGKYGNIYRIGADEFVFIGNKNTPIFECEEQLSKFVDISIPDKKISLTGIAYGYDIISKKSKSVFEVHSSAERNMNRLKNRLKTSNIR